MKVLVIAVMVAAAFAAKLDDQWEQWKQEHEKQYDDLPTETYRYGIWKDNMAMIDHHNKRADAGHETFWMEINHLGDMTREEIVATFNGYKMHHRNSTNVFKPSPGFKAAGEVDWRTKGAVTPVKNQGQCGSCWAFSTTGSLEGQHFLKDGRLVSLSEQNLIDCSKAEGNNGCKGGLMDRAFEYIIKNRGIDTEMSYPYQAHDEFCRFREAEVGATETSYKDILRGSTTGVMEACASVGPISVAMDASRSTFHYYKRGVYSDRLCSSTKLDHGVLVVGYGTYEGEPYFLVKNSWGSMWGMEGYFMISRDENMCGIATQASYPIV